MSDSDDETTLYYGIAQVSDAILRLWTLYDVHAFRGQRELTSKHLLMHNMRAEQVGLRFVPTSFDFPDEFKEITAAVLTSLENGPKTWIAKPVGSSRGRGIKLLKFESNPNLQDIPNPQSGAHLLQHLEKPVQLSLAQLFKHGKRYVVQQYIERPLLIQGYKFDFRLYVLVLSAEPLVAYRYREGFVRFCSEPYSSDNSSLDGHLTNSFVAANRRKKNPDAEVLPLMPDQTQSSQSKPQSAVRLSSFWELLIREENQTLRSKDSILQDIDEVLTNSLRAVCCKFKNGHASINDMNECFQLFGYDVILDSECKPWLLEVNGRPDMTCYSECQTGVKSNLISDVFEAVYPNASIEKASTNEFYRTKLSRKEFGFGNVNRERWAALC